MRLHNLLLVAVLAMTTSIAQATANRVLDTETITTNGATNVLTLPHITDSFVTNTFTATLTNKSLSGSANTFTNIPAGTALSGQTPVANGGTGLSTLAVGSLLQGNGTSAMNTIAVGSQFNVLVMGGSLPTWGQVNLGQSAAVSGTLPLANGGTGLATATLNGMVFGNGSSAMGVTAAGTQYQVFQAGSSGVPTVDAVHLDQSAAVTGTLPVASGGTGAATLSANAVLLGNGTSALQTVAPGTSGNVLTSNGTTWTSAAAPSGSTPNVTGSRASPTNVTAAGGITFSGTNYNNIAFVQGNAGAITVTANPQIAAATNVGQMLTLICRSATNTITIADGTGLSLNGGLVCGLDSILSLVWDGTNWVEISRR